MAVNVLVALLFSLVFVVGVLLGMYVTCLSYSMAETKAQRRARKDSVQTRNAGRRSMDSADWWKYHSADDDRPEDWGEWKTDPRDFPR